MTLLESIKEHEGRVLHLALDPGKDADGEPIPQINTGHGHSMDEFSPKAWAALLPLVKAGVTLFAGKGLGTSATVAATMLRGRLRSIRKELKSSAVFRRLTAGGYQKNRTEVLIEMAYQMGVPRLMKFKRMWAAIERADWEAASREVLYRNGDRPEDGASGLHQQTPKRAKFYAETLRTGVA